ncbi:DUF4190 domain-containing protein [Camelliibacillus cellulosilyticus]|uniref:DUF4190 domain-containing protein n=1 Tax=Camelliibacillus cellulosilyticus TaxID=2174486 RepID=A0ABV9GMX1_9BACL
MADKDHDRIGVKDHDDLDVAHDDYFDGAIDETVGDRVFAGDDLDAHETRVDNLDDRIDDEDFFNEEVAAESAIDRPIVDYDRDKGDDDVAGGTGIGWLALVLSAIGLFFLPVVMGAAGIIVGIIARRQGAKVLGAWAIGVGIAAIVIRLFTAPFF